MIPSINIGGLVLNDVTALISGSEEGFEQWRKVQRHDPWIGAIPTSCMIYSKGVIKFSNDGAGLMSETGAKGSTVSIIRTLGGNDRKKDLFGQTNESCQ